MFRRVNLRASLVIPAFLGALLGFPAPAEACSCMASTFEDARASAAAIFEGRVDTIEPDAAGGLRVRFHVTQAWRGVEHESVEITTATDSAACGYAFEVGQHYLVYASQAETSLAVSLCSRTARMDDASEDRQLLGSGVIPVDVQDDAEEPTPREPPATRAGCASCTVASSEAPPLAIAGTLLSLVLARHRRRSRR